MFLILSIILGSALGTFLGNLGLLLIVGALAQRQEKKQKEELLKLQNQFLEMRQKEVERMERYARMES